MAVNLALILQIFIIAALIPMIYAGLSLAPWMPSRKRDLERIFKLANMLPGEIFYELGSGTGQISFYFGRRGCQTVGLEISWPLFLYSKIKQAVTGTKNVEIKFRNIFTTDLGAADAVFVYAAPRIARRLQKKLTTELKPNARIISYAFAMPDWRPETINKPSAKDMAIYVYKKPLISSFPQ